MWADQSACVVGDIIEFGGTKYRVDQILWIRVRDNNQVVRMTRVVDGDTTLAFHRSVYYLPSEEESTAWIRATDLLTGEQTRRVSSVHVKVSDAMHGQPAERDEGGTDGNGNDNEARARARGVPRDGACP